METFPSSHEALDLNATRQNTRRGQEFTPTPSHPRPCPAANPSSIEGKALDVSSEIHNLETRRKNEENKLASKKSQLEQDQDKLEGHKEKVGVRTVNVADAFLVRAPLPD